MLPDFAQARQAANTRYVVSLQLLDRLVGGVPAVGISDDDTSPEAEKRREKARDIMSAWLNKNLADKMSEEQIAELADRTFDEAFADAEAQATTTFKHDDRGLYIEGRQIKAMFKEAGSRLGFGKAVKGGRPSLKQDLHEALHVDEQIVYLKRDGQHITEPDGYEARPITVMTAQGPRNAIKKITFVERCTVTFNLRFLTSSGLTEQIVIQILAFAQDLGLGADRSQSAGKFEVVSFDPAP